MACTEASQYLQNEQHRGLSSSLYEKRRLYGIESALDSIPLEASGTIGSLGVLMQYSMPRAARMLRVCNNLPYIAVVVPVSFLTMR